MKKIYLILFALTSLSTQVNGQQIPLYNHFYDMPYIQNAAYAGQDSVTQAFILYRNQWAGINNSPESVVAGIMGPLPYKNVGMGLVIRDETFNIHNKTSGYVTGSYGLALNSEHRLRFGMELGIVQNRIDFGEIENADPSDPAVLANNERKTVMDGNFGFVYAYKETVEIGFSALQILSNTAVFVNEGEQKYSSFKNLRHFLIHSKFYMPSSIFFDWEILAGFRSVQGLTTSWELGAKLDWQQKIWTVFLYRDQIGGVFGLGTGITKNIEFGYMFEFPSSGFGVINTHGTHELALRYTFTGK